MIENYYPSWLSQELINNCLPWQSGKNMSFRDFNEQYTLHDSDWIGIFYNIGYEQIITLAIDWDSVWLPDEIKKSIIAVLGPCEVQEPHPQPPKSKQGGG
ncbi:MAG: hypothetical protein V7K90_11670 [Nostoc sp.]|uniref:hypothetical protein n=1 Tax=Nostoc sp. TaxID=1180 RepID=UPI002FF5DF7D